MLLPSALDCAPGMQPMRSVYTTNTMLSPPPSRRQSTSSPANIFSTCRALQCLITTNLTPPPPIAKPSYPQPSLASPIVLDPPSRPHPKRPAPAPAPATHTITKAQHPQQQPSTSKKRRRSDTDSDSDSDSNTFTPSTPPHPHTTTTPSTPKRQRLHPPTLPLGLQRADFSALQEAAAAIPIPSTPLTARAHKTQPSTSITIQTAIKHRHDSALIPLLLLQNLHLSQREWDDCAQALGQGHHSIGARFGILFGGG